jgi:aminopeptidase O
LFRYLQNLLSDPSSFIAMLRHYVHDLHGRLVHSTDFLRFYFDTFPNVDENMDNVMERWLHTSGLNAELVSHYEEIPIELNGLYRVVRQEVEKWKSYDAKPVADFAPRSELLSEQIVLLFEELLELDRLTARTLRRLESTFKLSRSGSADVLHRWCELVVKHGYRAGLECLETFLVEHQAMGIYLYGELALSGRKAFKEIGKRVFKRIEAEMDVDLAKSVREMTFG